MADLPPGWRNVKLGDVLPDRMTQELAEADTRYVMTRKDDPAGAVEAFEKEIERLCGVREYMTFMEAHGLLPRFAKYMLQHILIGERK